MKMRKTIKQLEKENKIYRNALERIKDIENNPHLIFICDGDRKEVIVEREEK